MRWISCLLAMLVGCSTTVRFATFNAAMSGSTAGEMTSRLETGDDPQYRAVAEIIQRTRPDVLLLQEFDHDPTGRAVELFQTHYLGVSQNGADPIQYAHTFSPEVNTGEHSGVDLNNDGIIDPNPGSDAYAADCFGWGTYPGQYGMVVFSRFPIDHDDIRTYRKLTWDDLTINEQGYSYWPMNSDGSSYYSIDAKAVLRVSSKTHADVPIRIGGRNVHLLIAHPTPPVFDGPEDRNGMRNFLEVMLITMIVRERSRYSESDDWQKRIRSDQGLPPRLVPRHVEYEKPWPSRLATDVMTLGINWGHRGRGGASQNVVMGDMNCDPLDGDGRYEARATLAYRTATTFDDVALKPPFLRGEMPLREPAGPMSTGAPEAAFVQAGVNDLHRGSPAFDTADFPDAEPRGPGNLRVDYVIPSVDLRLVDSGVFWPGPDDPLYRLVKDNLSSDHRLVWVDVRIRR